MTQFWSTHWPNYEWSPVFQQLSVGAEQFEKTEHELGEVAIHAVGWLDGLPDAVRHEQVASCIHRWVLLPSRTGRNLRQDLQV